MIERYQDRTIAKIWSQAATVRRWLDVELAVITARHGDSYAFEVSALIAWDWERYRPLLATVERQMGHDVAAFVHVVCTALESHGDRGKRFSGQFHNHLTSSDVVDTAMAMAVKDSITHVMSLTNSLRGAVVELSKHQMKAVGRTHGRAALPIVWGDRFSHYSEQLWLAAQEISEVHGRNPLAKLRGPTGRELTTEFETQVCAQLMLPTTGLPTHQTQCASRINHFRVLSAMFSLALVLEKVAIDMRLLAIEEVGEVNEGYPEGRVGSSSMPHKKNPVNLEKVSGVVRVLRGHLFAASENSALWLERDISHSSAERILFPDFFHLVSHAISTLQSVLGSLQVFPDMIARNLGASAERMKSFDRLHSHPENGRTAAYRSSAL